MALLDILDSERMRDVPVALPQQHHGQVCSRESV